MKKKSKSQLMRKADQAFSLFIRKKYAVDGYVSCVTCGMRLTIAQAQAGHYIKRSIHSLRFSEDNVFPQCVRCNVFLRGNYPAYSLFLVRKFGKNHLAKLEEKSRQLTKTSVAYYQAIIERFS